VTDLARELLRFAPRCTFRLRVPVDGGLFRYDDLWPTSGRLNDGEWPFLNPPDIGDTVGLWKPDWRVEPKPPHPHGVYRVIERDWSYASYGSGAWPYGEPAPKVGPMLTLIVEPAEGPYRNEAPADEEETS
jgi:hypothetical protein